MMAAGPRLAVIALAAALATSIAYDVWRTPVQVSDSLTEILAARTFHSAVDAFDADLVPSAYFRPLRIATITALYDLGAPDRFHLVYRGFHVLLLVGLFAGFVGALRVKTADDAAAAALALLVMTGTHTFLSFVREAFPIQHFLEMAVLAVVALNLSVSRGGWWIDALAGLAFAAAALTLESGVLVWVVLAAGWIAGFRGVSGRGLAVVTVLLAGYFVLRFGYLHTDVPTLSQRSSGYLLQRLDPPDLEKLFGSRPHVFWAYNVAASWLSLWLSEPREGVFEFVRGWKNGDVSPRLYLWISTSGVMTATIVAAAAAWWRRPSQWTHAERLAFVALSVIAANAVLSFAYTKDDIVSVGGVFYAFAAYAAVRALCIRAAAWRRPAVVVVAVVILMANAGWTIRALGVHHVIVTQAFNTRNDWALVPITWRDRWPADHVGIAIIERLRGDALAADVPNPQLLPKWQDRWWGDR